tara:strand:+ start:223 stop:534 length:312 start_codon:yes stop_codon:yes gene_type:complete
MLQKLMLVKEAEAYLQRRLRPTNLLDTPLKLSHVKWTSHWRWDRELKQGEIEAIYVCEKSYTLQGMSKIDRLDMLDAGITLEEMYDALKGSTAEKISINRNRL